MEPPLPDTLRRLRGHGARRDLDPKKLAAKTALPEEVVRALLQGKDLPQQKVEERVCARIAAVAEAYRVRTKTRPAELVSEVADRLQITTVWARKLLTGEKMPNVTLLDELVDFFEIEGGQKFFTAPPAEALNRVLLLALRKYEDPNADPMTALLAKHGVSADLRAHGVVTTDELEKFVVDLIRSVVPPEEGDAP